MRFKNIHESEAALRNLLLTADSNIIVPIQIAPRSRASRPNAIDPGAVRVYSENLQQIIPYYVVSESAALGDSALRIFELLRDQNIPLDGQIREDRFVEVPLQFAKQIVELVRIAENDDGRWETEAVLALLESNAERFGATAFIYVRPFDPGDVSRRRVRGVLSGPEVAMARARSKFTLALTYAGPAAAPSYWYPTLVLPPNMPPHVFNPT
jgi:hypothetical protein